LRIDQLVPGDMVTLGFCDSSQKVAFEEHALFVAHVGYGPSRRATFAQVDRDNGNRVYQWDAYRFDGSWSYGTSAQRLRLMSLDVPAKPTLVLENP
jgi:hypothetical protein